MEFMLLGTYHLGETGDLVQLDAEEKSQYKEADFEELVAKLAEFKPTQIFVEFNMDNQEALDMSYQQFLQNKYSLKMNEIDQIGFRLAKHLKLDKLSAVDWNGINPHIPNLDDISSDTAKQQMQQVVTKAEQQMQLLAELISKKNIIDTFTFINTNEQNKENHQIYLDIMMFDDEIGFEWVANYWYYRNLKITKNIRSILEADTERALVIYGSGHNYLLHQMLSDVPHYKVVKFGEEA